ncbi:Zn-ribbon domain-containing OB-fold protein [Mycobacterium xenopi]|uniref:Acyl dehydratase n=1 Tax=Mycobacterium xenopi TaxID=1789 RepID=A0AAD1LZP1_MYCXE|nr:zinc ribbon domain-containing protein [Mycobacterium xenopi]MDA3639599.1 zinc ribbon domain-containing protein [Mycobacterium xenopi]MDA3657849.1 zinc ribbon domain-containing protein [Mycobacterium xenopi]MDA3663663.1 zinc ribbon domain-containing protein [Mycobacterium xenopi]ORX20476.1 acyl dehydratase [Mycobacterium xenopi]SPX79075.1 acyl dehydratase [Mycobacterium xenopi]
MNTTTTATLATTIPGDLVRIAVNKTTEPFWEAAQRRRLTAPQCAECGEFRMPPTPFCPNCRSAAVNWVELSGKATVYSFAVVHGFPGMPELTLVPAVLDLPDAPGARLVSNIIDVVPADVTIGMTAQVDFSPISDGWLLPVFRAMATKSDKD